MSTPNLQTVLDAASHVYRFVAKSISGTRTCSRAVIVATVSVAQNLLRLVSDGLADDLGRVKEAVIGKIEAECLEKQAEAERKMAEAAEAATKTGRRKRAALIAQREDELKQAEIAQKKAEAAKTDAEADRIHAEAEKQRADAEISRAEAHERVVAAVSKLRMEGGQVLVHERDLKKIASAPLPRVSGLDDGESPSAIGAEPTRSSDLPANGPSVAAGTATSADAKSVSPSQNDTNLGSAQDANDASTLAAVILKPPSTRSH